MFNENTYRQMLRDLVARFQRGQAVAWTNFYIFCCLHFWYLSQNSLLVTPEERAEQAVAIGEAEMGSYMASLTGAPITDWETLEVMEDFLTDNGIAP